jgi:hypothetical protein
MLFKYMDDMSAALRQFFPSMTFQQSWSLSLGGMSDVVGTDLFNQLLVKYGFDNNTSSQNYWQKNLLEFSVGTIGTPCSKGGNGGGIN